MAVSVGTGRYGKCGCSKVLPVLDREGDKHTFFLLTTVELFTCSCIFFTYSKPRYFSIFAHPLLLSTSRYKLTVLLHL